VKLLLRRQNLLGQSLMTKQYNIELYVQIYGIDQTNQFITKIAATKKERCELINEGWEFIKSDGDDCYFRKPK